MEICSGCGAASVGDRHPIGGVGWDKETGQFEVFPICDGCWRGLPGYRKVPLKMHFFERSQADVAVGLAGKGDIG